MCHYELFTHTDLLTNFVIMLNWTELFANKFQLFVSQKGSYSLRKAGRTDRKSICGQKTGHATGTTLVLLQPRCLPQQPKAVSSLVDTIAIFCKYCLTYLLRLVQGFVFFSLQFCQFCTCNFLFPSNLNLKVFYFKRMAF